MLSGRTCTLLAAGLILAQLVLRGWLLAGSSFYWDDLILIGRASEYSVLSWSYLGYRHDGHFMPLAFLVAGASTVLAPLEWWLPALTLLAGQLLASLAVWRMIRIVAPNARGGAVAALAFYLFTPMTVPAFAWWAAGLNALPMQAAMAWIVGDAVLTSRPDAGRQRSWLSRTALRAAHRAGGATPSRVRGRLRRGRPDPAVRRRWIAVRSTLVFIIGLGFFEKSVVILPVALIAVILAAPLLPARRARPGRRPGPAAHFREATAPYLAAVWRPVWAGRWLWAGLVLVAAVWAVIYLIGTTESPGNRLRQQTARLVWRSVTDGVVPALAGGPWEWERWIPGPPIGHPALWMLIVGWVLVAVGVLAALRYRVRGLVTIVAVAAYVIVVTVPVFWQRSATSTAVELAQTLRYLPDTALVITLAIALLAGARPQPLPRLDRLRPLARPVAATSVTVLIISSIVGTVGFTSSWRDEPTGRYLANAVDSMAADTEEPLLAQALPLEVLSPVAYPNNMTDRLFGRLQNRPPFGEVTTRLRVFDLDGHLVPGAVLPIRTSAASERSCADPDIDGATDLALSEPMLEWQWTVELPLCTDRAGQIDVALGDGEPRRVTVTAGLQVIYLRIDGGGTALRVTPVTPGLRLYAGSGRIGEAVDARYLP